MLDDEAEARLEQIKRQVLGEGPPPEWIAEQIQRAVEQGESVDAARKRIYLQLASDPRATQHGEWSGNLEAIAGLLRSYAPTLSDDAIAHIARQFEVVTFAAGEELVLQDEPGEAMYFIESGEVEVTRSPLGRGVAPPKHLTDLGSGTVVGEMSLVFNQPRTANVIARTDVRAYRLDKDSWLHIQAQYPIFAARIEAVAQQRAAELTLD